MISASLMPFSIRWHSRAGGDACKIVFASTDRLVGRRGEVQSSQLISCRGWGFCVYLLSYNFDVHVWQILGLLGSSPPPQRFDLLLNGDGRTVRRRCLDERLSCLCWQLLLSIPLFPLISAWHRMCLHELSYVDEIYYIYIQI